jgi:hypothetical protein
LKEDNWWKHNGISLILDANAVIEASDIESIRPKKAIQFLEQVV